MISIKPAEGFILVKPLVVTKGKTKETVAKVFEVVETTYDKYAKGTNIMVKNGSLYAAGEIKKEAHYLVEVTDVIGQVTI